MCWGVRQRQGRSHSPTTNRNPGAALRSRSYTAPHRRQRWDVDMPARPTVADEEKFEAEFPYELKGHERPRVRSRFPHSMAEFKQARDDVEVRGCLLPL